MIRVGVPVKGNWVNERLTQWLRKRGGLFRLIGDISTGLISAVDLENHD